jgi:hypothetical protein
MFILRQEILEYVKQVGEDWTTSSFCAYAMPWEEKEKNELGHLWRDTFLLRIC